MKKPNDGGPAFPLNNNERHGMSLRDYFAAQALVGVIAARTTLSVENINDDINQESIAEECYEIADAMLVERERPAEEEGE